ncbi:MAG TPA: hypothetical protein VFF03_05845 [Rhodocyclaceae bacterium]|nr:hypothetical protein [Rhodocyclaceae bacterium]
MNRLPLPGLVTVNGALSYDDPSVYVSDECMIIRSAQSDFAIPIIELYWVNVPMLINSLRARLSKSIHLEIHGNFIGETHDLSGYAAADSGECVRPIERLDFELQYSTSEFRILLSGRTGDYVAATCHGMPMAKLANSAIDFSVDLQIPDDHLPQVLAGKDAELRARTMIGYRNMALNTPSIILLPEN